MKWTARWNVAPTDEVATMRQDRHGPKRIFGLMRWGMIPYWAKDISIGAKTINAVCETAAEKPVFHELMKKRRCLILADGFYEWKNIGPKSKQAYNLEWPRMACLLCRSVGQMEKLGWKINRILRDNDHRRQHVARRNPRPDANHPSTKGL